MGKAWLFYSEYSLHMYFWLLFGWAKDKGIAFWGLSEKAGRSRFANIDFGKRDTDPLVNKMTVLLSILGF